MFYVEFNVLCTGRCKPLGSVNSFLSYAPHISGANLVSLFTLLLALPQLFSNHCGGGSLCWITVWITFGFPGGSDGKESTCNAGYLGSIPGLGRSPGGGHGNPLQFLAWRTPWREEPGGWQSTGSQRVGHDWVTKHSTVHSHLEARNPW